MSTEPHTQITDKVPYAQASTTLAFVPQLVFSPPLARSILQAIYAAPQSALPESLYSLSHFLDLFFLSGDSHLGPVATALVCYSSLQCMYW